ncbi:hypothetical protein FA10DRAFT_260728 [Acaromyces ingoldii]|uniref:Uncharacterized protein n=1 Tax=Acaromyces ingoldii TaxID=215250 RepID=A0A316YTC6_9BASI|nr:hypothetical protein FA10DRAFT_260728 [Acaromyces ingoldii]PWN90995.1 hypothetical protein FA10DRAFT_260728 [Acaromyces ingoldii]
MQTLESMEQLLLATVKRLEDLERSAVRITPTPAFQGACVDIRCSRGSSALNHNGCPSLSPPSSSREDVKGIIARTIHNDEKDRSTKLSKAVLAFATVVRQHEDDLPKWLCVAVSALAETATETNEYALRDDDDDGAPSLSPAVRSKMGEDAADDEKAPCSRRSSVSALTTSPATPTAIPEATPMEKAGAWCEEEVKTLNRGPMIETFDRQHEIEPQDIPHSALDERQTCHFDVEKAMTGIESHEDPSSSDSEDDMPLAWHGRRPDGFPKTRKAQDTQAQAPTPSPLLREGEEVDERQLNRVHLEPGEGGKSTQQDAALATEQLEEEAHGLSHDIKASATGQVDEETDQEENEEPAEAASKSRFRQDEPPATRPAQNEDNEQLEEAGEAEEEEEEREYLPSSPQLPVNDGGAVQPSSLDSAGDGKRLIFHNFIKDLPIDAYIGSCAMPLRLTLGERNFKGKLPLTVFAKAIEPLAEECNLVRKGNGHWDWCEFDVTFRGTSSVDGSPQTFTKRLHFLIYPDEHCVNGFCLGDQWYPRGYHYEASGGHVQFKTHASTLIPIRPNLSSFDIWGNDYATAALLSPRAPPSHTVKDAKGEAKSAETDSEGPLFRNFSGDQPVDVFIGSCPVALRLCINRLASRSAVALSIFERVIQRFCPGCIGAVGEEVGVDVTFIGMQRALSTGIKVQEVSFTKYLVFKVLPDSCVRNGFVLGSDMRYGDNALAVVFEAGQFSISFASRKDVFVPVLPLCYTLQPWGGARMGQVFDQPQQPVSDTRRDEYQQSSQCVTSAEGPKPAMLACRSELARAPWTPAPDRRRYYYASTSPTPERPRQHEEQKATPRRQGFPRPDREAQPRSQHVSPQVQWNPASKHDRNCAVSGSSSPLLRTSEELYQPYKRGHESSSDWGTFYSDGRGPLYHRPYDDPRIKRPRQRY